MQLQHVFKKTKSHYIPIRGSEYTPELPKPEAPKPEVPQGLVRKCNKCGKAILASEVMEHYYVCPKCGGYFRLPAYKRIELVAEKNTFEEWDTGLTSNNPLSYKGYMEKLELLSEKTGLDEAVVTGKAKIGTHEAVLAVMDGRFLMASMGEVVGEKIARAVERATKERLPVIIFTCSGGARMQEGIVSLMQMAKTSAALKRHSDAGLLYVSVLTDPTTGGVTASFAMLGDIILAEPKALIGFAGQRVIEQTIGQKLPKEFQRSEFLQEHGFVDAIVTREEMKKTLVQILKLHKDASLQKQTDTSLQAGMNLRRQNGLQNETDKQSESNRQTGTVQMQASVQNISAWERVQISRKQGRPVGEHYIQNLFDDFVELHGDRYFGDDKSVMGGIATFHGQPVTVIAQAKGKNTKENIERNFGMPSPEGYRKALRLMKQAEKFRRPVICFVDTPGAFCGIEAEERGQGEAIARNLYEMSAMKTPILSIVIGEGGSGGALAFAVADEVWMLENAVYSILSPEGYAAILWKDSSRAKEAAEVMKMTAEDLKNAGVIERVIPEPAQMTVESMSSVTLCLEQNINVFLKKYRSMKSEELVEKRYRRFRQM